MAPVVQATFSVTQNLSDTDRGAGGFGSTGKSDVPMAKVPKCRSKPNFPLKNQKLLKQKKMASKTQEKTKALLRQPQKKKVSEKKKPPRLKIGLNDPLDLESILVSR